MCAVHVEDTLVAEWQQVADLMAQMADVPAGLIMRVDGPDIEVLVASRTADNPYASGSREPLEGSGLYCEKVVRSRDALEIPDARASDQWKQNPDTGLGMYSYLGYPLFLPDGAVFGTLCVLDSKERRHGERTKSLMLRLKSLIESHLALIAKNDELARRIEEIETLRGILPMCAHCKRIRDDSGYWEAVETYMSSHSRLEFTHGVCPDCLATHFPGYKSTRQA